jgi:hypothetical protein
MGIKGSRIFLKLSAKMYAPLFCHASDPENDEDAHGAKCKEISRFAA